MKSSKGTRVVLLAREKRAITNYYIYYKVISSKENVSDFTQLCRKTASCIVKTQLKLID
jgi:hypothetical protein